MSTNLNIAPKFVPAEFESFDEPVAENLSATQHIWLCICFSELALQVPAREQGMPFAIIEQQKNRHVIFAACDIAQSQGITPGMLLNAAYALCRNLRVRMRDTAFEHKKLEQLAQQAGCFTPNIALQEPDALLLEVSNSLKLFGGMQKLQDHVRDVFTTHKQTFSLAIAPTPTAAWLMAHNGMETTVTDKAGLKSVLGVIALIDTGLSMKLVESLSKSGLYTLRDLWRLPRDGLARRFGVPLLEFLDRTCGMQPDLRCVFIPGVRLKAELELPVHSNSVDFLLIALEKLLEQAEVFLRKHDAMTDLLLIELWHDRTTHTPLPVRLQRAARQSQRFLAVINERLEHLTLPDKVDRVTLRIDQVVPYATSHADLFDKHESDEQDWQQLVEIIKARIGDEKIYCVQVATDHRPERAWRYGSTGKIHNNNDTQEWLKNLHRPTGLLPQARPIALDKTKLKFITDAERIESGWWDDNDISRDYYVAVSAKGSRWWVYQDLKQGKEWYLHGLFA
ncbi:MAG: DNA polymerase Y family protein [Gammaproteobacteria bacterium]|nr:DNA polymerase Y family protein [Gammaproteobacteria bacterium]